MTSTSAPEPEHAGRYTRLSCNINLETADALRRDKPHTGSATESIRRAVAVYKMVTDVIRDGGRVLVQRDKDKDDMQELILL